MFREIRAKINRYWVRFTRRPVRVPAQWRLFALCVLVGLIAGTGAIVFHVLLELAQHTFLDGMAGYRTPGMGGVAPIFTPGIKPFQPWMLAVLPVLGGLVSGFIVYRLAPEAEGHGTDAAINAYHYKGGKVRRRVPFVKTITSAITIGTGGSAGAEGPIAQIGSGFGSALADWLGLGQKERRILLISGMAAGVGAIFHAPLAGALFAAEVLYRDPDMEFEILIPAVIASIVAYSLFALKFGWQPLFVTPQFEFSQPSQLLAYGVLALVVAGAAILFVKIFYAVRDSFATVRVSHELRPALGGALTGVFAFFLPEAMGAGYEIVQRGLTVGTSLEQQFGGITVWLLLAVGFGKMLTTSFTVGSGGSGGVFGPSLVIGGALGGATGMILQAALPWIPVQPGAFALVGMTGFFAAAANTPLCSIIMISEITGNYRLLVPAMWVGFISYMLARHASLYEKQPQSRAQSPTHLCNMAGAVLARLTVRSLLAERNALAPEQKPLAMSDPVRLAKQRLARAGLGALPVADAEGRLTGLVYSRDLRELLSAHSGLLDALLVQDIAAPPLAVEADDTLFVAVSAMRQKDVDEIAVVDAEGCCLGMLSLRDVIQAYDLRLTDEGAPA